MFMVITTSGCTNKMAVQELNQKAQAYMNEGRVEDAIARLESSIDLDNTIYETYYNLAVAYMKVGKYDKAKEALEHVEKINPDFADAYYTMAVMYENSAYDLINGVGNTNNTVISDENQNISVEKELSLETKNEICNKLDSAIDYYNKYLIKKQKADDKDKVNDKINALNAEIQRYSTKSENEQ